MKNSGMIWVAIKAIQDSTPNPSMNYQGMSGLHSIIQQDS
jgi:hypothetical protein